MNIQALTGSRKRWLGVMFFWLWVAIVLAEDVQTSTLAEQEEILPFAAVDGSGRAVSDLRKAEIVLLVNGLNFRGFSLLHPLGSPFNAKPQAIPELAKSPPNAYYEISFPYVWDAGQEIRIQLGTSRAGVQLTAPRSIEKRKSLSVSEDLKAEILALDLLRGNTWLNMDLASLNLFAAGASIGERRKEPAGIYQIRLPASFLKDRIDLFRITFPPAGADISLLRQWVAPTAELLQIDRGGETYLLLADRQKAAALLLPGAPLAAGTQVRLTPDETAQVAAAIADRQKRLAALQNEVKRIPVELLADLAAGSAESAARPVRAAPVSGTAPATPIPVLAQADVRSPALSALESFRSALTKTTKMHYCEEALKHLRQNQVAQALPFLAQSLDEFTSGNDFTAALLARLRRLEGFQRDTADEAEALAGMDLQKGMQRLQSAIEEGLAKDKGREFFADLQEILDKIQKEIDLVRRTLAQMPGQMDPAGGGSLAGNRIFAAGIPELRGQIDHYLSAAGEISSKTFISEGWTIRVMNDLRRILGQYTLHAGAAEQCLSRLPEALSEASLRFAMANNRLFSRAFKRSFYEKKLRSLGISAEWLSDPSFADVVIQAQALEKNGRGFWEASFADELAMIYIPPGSFTMGIPWESGGAEDESPPHPVTLDGYWIAKNEATFSQYDRFCEETGRLLPSDFGKGRRKQPVIGISYQDAADYCQWLCGKTGVRFRLPTEAEWERAARGVDGRKYPWGNSEPDGRLGNFADANFLEYYRKANSPADESEKKQMLQWIAAAADDGYIFTAPVGSFPLGASPCGAMDMAGNVWEWVADWYDGNYYQKSPPRNPPGSFSGIYRVVRGGGWDCNPWMLRSTTRCGAPPIPGKGSESIGFRVAASPLPAARQEGPGDPGGVK